MLYTRTKMLRYFVERSMKYLISGRVEMKSSIDYHAKSKQKEASYFFHFSLWWSHCFFIWVYPFDSSDVVLGSENDMSIWVFLYKTSLYHTIFIRPLPKS